MAISIAVESTSEGHTQLGALTLLCLPRPKSRVDEEILSADFTKAQQARWSCQYDEVRQRLARLRKVIPEANGVVSNYWRAKLLDLKVEVTFTIGKKPKSARALEQTETAIKSWAGLHEPAPLMHAHLRKAVIYRQMFTESQATRRQVDSHIHDSLLTLYQAEEEVLPDLKRSIAIDARATAFSFYSDLAKTLSHARQFDLAKRYLKEAQSICNELEELAPRRALDLLITRAVFVRECFLDKRIFGHASQLDKLAESINNGATHCFEFDDVVLTELLLKSQIPMLVGTGKREEAEEILKHCQVHARHHRLYNQQRDLLYLARSLRLGSAYCQVTL